MERLKVGSLPTGAVDNDGAPIRIPVTFALPTRGLNNLALELAKIHEGRGQSVALNEASVNQLRLCLRTIDDEPVVFGDLEHGGIDKLLTQKQQDTLMKAFAKLTTATEGEVRGFVADLEYIDRDDDRLCVGEIPASCRVVDPPKPAEEGNPPAPRRVTFRLPNRKTVAKAQEGARRFEQRGALVAANEANLNMIRFCVTEIDGRPLDEVALRGDAVDKFLEQREQSLLVLAFELLMTAEQGEVDDFLGTLGAPVTRQRGVRSISPTPTTTQAATVAE